MLSAERKRLILESAGRDGRVVATELSRRFNVSEDTIRRDLRELAADGLLHRVHGGALPLPKPPVSSLCHMPARSMALPVYGVRFTPSAHSASVMGCAR